MIKIHHKIDFLEQLTILEKCIALDLNLQSELAARGFDRDSLIYRYNRPIAPHPAIYQTLDSYQFKSCGIPAVSFFSGAGGLDLGFEYAGFQHLASVEINPMFCQTLRKNFPNSVILGPPDCSGNARDRDKIVTLLESKIGINYPFEGVFFGGPPCQSFSIAANQRFTKGDENFKRTGFLHAEHGNLLFEFIWYICQFKPRAFLIENVAGLLSIDGGEQIAAATEILQNSGYEVATPTVLNAADFGVPQNRSRLFLCGWRTPANFTFPQPEPFKVPCYKALEKPLINVENHVTRQHKAESVIRYIELKYGERDRLGRVDRLDPNLPAKTVIAGGSKGGGRSHLHPLIPRTLSVRESARLQTFPDSFIFCGSSARQFTQVGNAVPPLLALKLARAISTKIYGIKSE
ncbi:MAG: DNA cytosine methyltransferase [Oscillatoriaceae cyanobacterium Prado104]|jgi:DNA (cytosine-5)-methyltransferase 1|nr:DNA cytosine methyltransferase [Oscillatoriaceae cyanobacterium Prado104]